MEGAFTLPPSIVATAHVAAREGVEGGGVSRLAAGPRWRPVAIERHPAAYSTPAGGSGITKRPRVPVCRTWLAPGTSDLYLLFAETPRMLP
jgi:hypothetical protein